MPRPSLPRNRIVRLSLDHQAADLLREQLLSGRLKVGDRLIESQMAGELGVSRGTMRAALQKLAAEGLIRQVPFSWWTVAPLSPHDAWELYTLRASLEGLAASLVAALPQRTRRQPIGDAYEALKAACATGDYVKAAEVDLALHRTMVEAAGHQRLLAHWRQIEQQTRLFLVSSNALLQSIGEIAQEHDAMVTAILAGDPERADKAARTLLLKDGADLVRHLEKAERAASQPKAHAGRRRKTA